MYLRFNWIALKHVTRIAEVKRSKWLSPRRISRYTGKTMTVIHAFGSGDGDVGVRVDGGHRSQISSLVDKVVLNDTKPINP